MTDSDKYGVWSKDKLSGNCDEFLVFRSIIIGILDRHKTRGTFN